MKYLLPFVFLCVFSAYAVENFNLKPLTPVGKADRPPNPGVGLGGNCIDFDLTGTNLNNWYSFNVSDIQIVTNPLDLVNPTATLVLTDDFNGSIAINNTDFGGNWLQLAQDGCLCFDYKVDWSAIDGSNAGSFPKFNIYTGPAIGTLNDYQNTSTRAVFVGNINNPLLQDNVWGHYCLPIRLSANGLLPSNSFGEWLVVKNGVVQAGAVAASEWDMLIQNVTGIVLPTDYNSNPSEDVYFDNFCWTCSMAPCEDLSVTATQDSSGHCCWTLDYLNAGADLVYGIELTALDGVTFDPNYSAGTGYFIPNHTSSSLTVVPDGLTLMPAQADDFVRFCLKDIAAMPQFVVVSYLDANYQPFCSDTLTFACMPEQSCLYIVNDSLVCDSSGYKYIVNVSNPAGATFPVTYINFNINPPLPGVTYSPSPPSFTLTDTLFPGDTTMLMFLIQTNQDLFGDSLCFILSAHDGPEERLCCAEIDTCIAFPLCDPCDYVDAEVAIGGPGDTGNCFGGEDPLHFPWLQAIISTCSQRPCGAEISCCTFQGQPVVVVTDDSAQCTDPFGSVYDANGNILFVFGGIGGINMDLADQLENCILIYDCNQAGDCCYDLLVSNNYPVPNYFSNIQTVILTPGVTFSATEYQLGNGWTYAALTPMHDYLWSHSSGSIPTLNGFNLFDFCIEGVTTTDSVCIAVHWLQGGEILCSDTVKVFCPECVEVVSDSILCNADGTYTYTFSGINHSEYGVNTVGFVGVPPPLSGWTDVVPLGSLIQPGDPFGPISVTLPAGIGATGDTVCFDLVLRQVLQDSIDILCCYARHCIDLPDCEGDSSDISFSFISAASFCIEPGPACMAQVTFDMSVQTTCPAAGLSFQLLLDLNGDGSVEDDLADNGVLSGTYPDYFFNYTLPAGNHTLTIIATDACGTQVRSVRSLLVADCTPPNGFACINGINAELMLIDTDGDGSIDGPGVILTPTDLLVAPGFDLCSPPVTYSINIAGVTPDPSQTSLLLTCPQLGVVIIEIYAWDSAFNPFLVQPDGTVGGPNYDFCQTTVLVSENGVCPIPPPAPPPALAGIQLTPNPAGNLLQVTTQYEGEAELSLIHADGSMRRSESRRFVRDQALQIDISTLHPGVYLLRLRRADGAITVQRFVKM